MEGGWLLVHLGTKFGRGVFFQMLTERRHMTQQVTEGRRLGCGKEFAAWDDVKANSFFANTDWEALAQKKTTPPVLPSDPGKDMVNNFDDDFTK